MKLFNFLGAPNSKRVWLYVKQRRLPIEIVEMDVMNGALASPDYLAKNPFGLVPVLEIEPDEYLRESIVIVDYLEERFGASGLFGDTILERARIAKWNACSTCTSCRISAFTPTTWRPFSRRDTSSPRQRRNKSLISLDKAAATIRGFGIGPDYLLFDKLTVADLTAYAVLEFCEKCEAKGWHAQTPLLDWYERFHAKADALAAA